MSIRGANGVRYMRRCCYLAKGAVGTPDNLREGELTISAAEHRGHSWVDHVSIFRWVQRFAPKFARRLGLDSTLAGQSTSRSDR